MFILKYKNIFLALSGILVGLSIILVAVFGLKPGIEFRGGSLTEVAFTDTRPNNDTIQAALKDSGIESPLIQETGDKGVVIRTHELKDAERDQMLNKLQTIAPLELKSFTSIGPSVGTELTRKSIISIVLVSLAIILFIAFAFRHVSRPVASWKYGLIAIVTLIHDIAIPSGLFAILAKTQGAELDTLFVVALLTILGLSVSDTIVVFDRIRENLKIGVGKTFEETVGTSLSQTFTRSINTSLTVILALAALYFFGPETTRTFSLILITGMFFGTYSSIFVASPILVLVEKFQNKKKK